LMMALTTSMAPSSAILGPPPPCQRPCQHPSTAVNAAAVPLLCCALPHSELRVSALAGAALGVPLPPPLSNALAPSLGPYPCHWPPPPPPFTPPIVQVLLSVPCVSPAGAL
jgi:hypothetical protein